MSAPIIKKVLITWAVGQWREPVERSVSGPEFASINVVFCTEREQILRELADTDVLCAGDVDDEMVAAAPQLNGFSSCAGSGPCLAAKAHRQPRGGHLFEGTLRRARSGVRLDGACS